jgi:3-hydroxybutyryl-CoA dehydrogenase
MDPLAPGAAETLPDDLANGGGSHLRGHALIVVGAGLMGAQIGVEFALHGFRVHFLTVHIDGAQARVRDTLARVASLGLASRSACESAADRVSIVGNVVELPSSARFVIESLPEDLALKSAVLHAVAEHASAAILGSNTSSLSITELGERVGAPTRTLGMHYWNPPMLMPLVELTASPTTDPGAVAIARALVHSVGKTPVIVRRDVPGFIWNRLQMAILREALWLVANDVATIEDVDAVTRLGLARRWRQTGLFASIFLGGPETWERVAANLFPVLSDATDAEGLADLVREASASWSDSLDERDRALADDVQVAQATSSRSRAGRTAGEPVVDRRASG